MRLRELQDIYLDQDIYIVGSGPTLNLFPLDFLQDKICIALNDAYKKHPAITPIALMNNQLYAHADDNPASPYHEYFKAIKYPIIKPQSQYRVEKIEWDHPYFYCFERSTQIHKIDSLTKETDHLYYAPDGCALHPALQIAWIMGARTIFVVGCDSCTFENQHYAAFDKGGIGTVNITRNYDAYVYGTLMIQKFLNQQGVTVLNLSPIVGYHRVDDQFQVLADKSPCDLFK
jgi:hypothetical protein